MCWKQILFLQERFCPIPRIVSASAPCSPCNISSQHATGLFSLKGTLDPYFSYVLSFSSFSPVLKLFTTVSFRSIGLADMEKLSSIKTNAILGFTSIDAQTCRLAVRLDLTAAILVFFHADFRSTRMTW